MGFFDEIKKIDAHSFGMYVLLVLGIFAPGFMVIFLYLPEYIVKLDTVKQLFFSAFLSLPVCILNIIFYSPTDAKDKDLNQAIIFSAYFTSIVIYFSVLMAYLLRVNFRTFLLFVLISELSIVLPISFKKYKKNRNNGK